MIWYFMLQEEPYRFFSSRCFALLMRLPPNLLTGDLRRNCLELMVSCQKTPYKKTSYKKTPYKKTCLFLIDQDICKRGKEKSGKRKKEKKKAGNDLISKSCKNVQRLLVARHCYCPPFHQLLSHIICFVNPHPASFLLSPTSPLFLEEN